MGKGNIEFFMHSRLVLFKEIFKFVVFQTFEGKRETEMSSSVIKSFNVHQAACIFIRDILFIEYDSQDNFCILSMSSLLSSVNME